jgi:hypothetical protein
MSAQVWLAIITGLLGLLTVGFLALLNAWISARAGVDEDLRSQRLELYPKLWSATAAVSRWPRVDVTRGSLEELHRDLRTWYYARGGLFLSESARARYGDVQELIATLLTHTGGPADVLVPDGYTALMNTASALRTALTEDLDTRRRKSFRENRRQARWHRKAAQEAQARISRARESAPMFVNRGTPNTGNERGTHASPRHSRAHSEDHNPLPHRPTCPDVLGANRDSVQVFRSRVRICCRPCLRLRWMSCIATDSTEPPSARRNHGRKSLSMSAWPDVTARRGLLAAG